jgi:threonine dehydratase
MLLVPPYDDNDVIAGAGTVALEALEQVPDLDVFLAPCGGGGLLSGCAAYLAGVRPGAEVWGVEAARANDTWLSFQKGERVKISLPDTIADGMRNLIPGGLTFPLIRRHCQGILLVSEDEIRGAVSLLFSHARAVAEPTGAVAPAAALFRKLDLRGRSAVAVVSGGNVDPKVYASCLEA